VSDTAINIGNDSYDKFVVFIIMSADEIGFPKMVLKNAVMPIIIEWICGTDVKLSYKLPIPPPIDMKTNFCPPEHPEINVKITLHRN
jgi:hypothetical protein